MQNATVRLPASNNTRNQPGRWLQFLVGDVDALPMRVFEVLFTFSFLIWMGRCFMTWEEWLTDRGFHLTETELTMLGYPTPFELMTGPGVVCLAALIILAATAHLLNYLRRLALLVLFGCTVYVQGADLMASFTLNKLYVGIYGVLLLSPGYAHDAVTSQLKIPAVAVRVIQATLILQYLAAGLAKAFNGDWLFHGDVLHVQVQGVYRNEIAAWCLRHLPAWYWTVMQFTSLLFELEAPVLFCMRKLRWLAFVLGMGFHMMIALLMKDLIFFSLQMWTFYALFVTADEWQMIAAKGRSVCARLLPTLIQKSPADK